jgi:hypothetical protein
MPPQSGLTLQAGNSALTLEMEGQVHFVNIPVKGNHIGITASFNSQSQ